ncbi:MAG TPA: 50S ribosomal protein L5 [Patescibacteria group bacterium]
MNNLKQTYEKEIKDKLKEEFKYGNVMEIPQVVKVVINVGVGEATSSSQVIEKVREQIAAISGQQPSIRLAKKAISAFKLRVGQPIGVSVTLRGERMYQFLEKLFKVILPRVRDFQGVSQDSFDNFGNYNLGLKEQTIFPEIDYSKVDKIRGLEITFVTNAKNKEESKKLLELMGMPFRKESIS